MYHKPENYQCPFCDWLAGNETEYKQNSDIVYQDSHITAFVSPKWWVNNPGHVIVIPNNHTENIYTISNIQLSRACLLAKKVAIAIRSSYKDCTGTSIRQHNEPDGNQDVWHFHIHVFPRYSNDKLYENHQNKQFVAPHVRKAYADILREVLAD